jgi:hypothetical protein
MTDDLVERVARAICATEVSDPDGINYYGKPFWTVYARFAEAAIAIALEEAAEVCEVDWDSESRTYGRVFAAAIRGMITGAAAPLKETK